jgi:hypothetical protein
MSDKYNWGSPPSDLAKTTGFDAKGVGISTELAGLGRYAVTNADVQAPAVPGQGSDLER